MSLEQLSVAMHIINQKVSSLDKETEKFLTPKAWRHYIHAKLMSYEFDLYMGRLPDEITVKYLDKTIEQSRKFDENYYNFILERKYLITIMGLKNESLN